MGCLPERMASTTLHAETQMKTIEEFKANLKEAVELYLESFG